MNICARNTRVTPTDEAVKTDNTIKGAYAGKLDVKLNRGYMQTPILSFGLHTTYGEESNETWLYATTLDQLEEQLNERYPSEDGTRIVRLHKSRIDVLPFPIFDITSTSIATLVAMAKKYQYIFAYVPMRKKHDNSLWYEPVIEASPLIDQLASHKVFVDGDTQRYFFDLDGVEKRWTVYVLQYSHRKWLWQKRKVKERKAQAERTDKENKEWNKQQAERNECHDQHLMLRSTAEDIAVVGSFVCRALSAIAASRFNGFLNSSSILGRGAIVNCKAFYKDNYSRLFKGVKLKEDDVDIIAGLAQKIKGPSIVIVPCLRHAQYTQMHNGTGIKATTQSKKYENMTWDTCGILPPAQIKDVCWLLKRVELHLAPSLMKKVGLSKADIQYACKRLNEAANIINRRLNRKKKEAVAK